jgi:uncharacterized protein YdeI (BOF family)
VAAFSASLRSRSRLAIRRTLSGTAAVAVLAGSLLHSVAGVAGWTASGPASVDALAEPVEHLLISELMTGGASASDEFIELFNPAPQSLSLDGLELVYVTASGATVSRKAAWPAAGPSVPPGGHLLLANEGGVHSAMADATYASGLSATGGSVVLRSVGAATGIDAVGWGTAAAWLEGEPAPAPAAGHSLERLPGGDAGSGWDTDHNAADFVERPTPDPQGSASQATPVGTTVASSSASSTPSFSPSPSASIAPPATTPPTPTPTAAVTAVATPAATLPPSASPTSDDELPIAEARALADGSHVTIAGFALTDSQFTDGGGYVTDSSGGIAVLLGEGSFPRGVLVRVSGELDDRYHQRTIRATTDGLTLLGPGDDPEPTVARSGQVGEQEEGTLVRLAGSISGAPSRLTSSLAFDLDDGSGAIRVVVNDATGIAVDAMLPGTFLDLVGVVGQRDSSGTGLEGYRLQPRDQQDVRLLAIPTATPAASGSSGATATAAPSTGPADGVVTVAAARLAQRGAHVTVRGVVTLPSSVLHDGTAAVEDETGAIVARLGDEAGELALGELVVIDGVRSTKSGMETIRSSIPPLRLGLAGQPEPLAASTGAVGEDLEARLVRVGGVATAPRRTSAQNVYFDLDDGSGLVRVFISPSTGIDSGGVIAGSWVEVTGVVGQETSGQQPLRGYRIWPRTADDLRMLAADGGASGSPAAEAGADENGDTPPRGRSAKPSSALLPVLAPPRLVARGPSPKPPRSSPSPSLDAPGDAAAAAPETPSPATATLQIALLAVVVAGAAGTLAASRPGLTARLSEAARQLLPAAAEAGVAELPLPPASSSVEVAAARLVPLRVVDDGRQDPAGTHAERTR